MASIRFTDQDRDDRGFVTVPEPRSLADLLPTPASIQADAQRAPRRPMPRATLATQIGIGLALVAAVAYLYISGDVRPAAPPRVPATVAAATQIGGDSVLAPSPLPATVPAAKTVAGYWSPDGVSAGELDPTKITRVVDVRGAWARIEMDGGGLVWTSTQVIPHALLAAYTPPTALPIPTRVPIVATDPPPPPCAEAGIAGKMVEVCDYADLSDLEARAKAKWIEQYGGNVGIVVTPSPQEWNRP